VKTVDNGPNDMIATAEQPWITFYRVENTAHLRGVGNDCG